MTGTALVLFAHGARDPEWSVPVHRIRDRIAARRPGLRVEIAFLEFMAPPLPDTIAQLAESGVARVLVAPLFLAPGGHLKRDVPELLEAVRRRFPAVRFDLLPVLGEIPGVLDATADFLVQQAES